MNTEITSTLSKKELDSIYEKVLRTDSKELFVSFISNKGGLTTNALHLHVTPGTNKLMVTHEVFWCSRPVKGRYYWNENRIQKYKSPEPLVAPLELGAFLYNRLNLSKHLTNKFSIEFFITKIGLTQIKGLEQSYKRYQNSKARLQKKYEKHHVERDKQAELMSKAWMGLVGLKDQFPDLLDRKLI